MSKTPASIQKRIDEIQKEINTPHQCGAGCLCLVLKIKIDILQIYLDKAKNLNDFSTHWACEKPGKPKRKDKHGTDNQLDL